ncbi:MAG TPA: YitT family protein [Candidatus Scybalocola faecavium]|nr:YitT family protein [Candidatus Scybalocola faecavium]
MSQIRRFTQKLMEGLSVKKVLLIILGAMICTFGIHNIHQQTGITEGGVIGMMLLVENWLGISPALITPVLDIACYLLAFKYLGGRFIKISVISTLSVSLFYKIWELFPHMLPDLSAHPLAAALAGGLFVGVGVGIIVRQGGSSGGDDALALTISRVTRWRLSRAYLFTDLVVLGLSLTYIPFTKIVFSVITVTLSSFLIDHIQEFNLNKLFRRTSEDGENCRITDKKESVKL